MSAFAQDAKATHVVLYSHAVNQKFVGDAHSRGLQVFVYTINNPEETIQLCDLRLSGSDQGDFSLLRKNLEKS